MSIQPAVRHSLTEVAPIDVLRFRTGLPDAEAAERILQDARNARREMALLKKDCDRPGEFSPMARLLWRHVPSLAQSLGAKIQAGEGWPQGSPEAEDPSFGIRSAAFDARRSSFVADWAGPSLSPTSRLLFAGADQGNSIDNLIDRISKVEDFERRDSLQRQKHGFLAALSAGRGLA